MVNTKVRLIMLFVAKDGEALYKIRSNIKKKKKKWPRADCGSDRELLIIKFRLKLKKVEKTTRPLRYDLNQIPYDYTVEVTNRFKGLDLIECLKNYVWRFGTLYRRQWSRPSPGKGNAKKAKWLSDEALQIAEKRREAKDKEEKERSTHLNAEFQRTARIDEKASLSEQCKEIEERNRMEMTRDLFKKMRDIRGTVHAKMGTVKGRNGMHLTEVEDTKKRWKEYTEELYK